MSFWATAIVAANNAVTAPTVAISVGDQLQVDSDSSGEMRVIRYTPAVTIVAAWISAETGVGPSIASGSQRYSGNWALLPTAPMNNIMAMTVPVDLASEPVVAALFNVT